MVTVLLLLLLLWCEQFVRHGSYGRVVLRGHCLPLNLVHASSMLQHSRLVVGLLVRVVMCRLWRWRLIRAAASVLLRSPVMFPACPAVRALWAAL